MALEEKFEISLDDQDANKADAQTIATVGDACHVVIKAMEAKAATK